MDKSDTEGQTQPETAIEVTEIGAPEQPEKETVRVDKKCCVIINDPDLRL